MNYEHVLLNPETAEFRIVLESDIFMIPKRKTAYFVTGKTIVKKLIANNWIYLGIL